MGRLIDPPSPRLPPTHYALRRTRRGTGVRLNRTSQLAGFAKEGDLAWFARTLCGIETEAILPCKPVIAGVVIANIL